MANKSSSKRHDGFNSDTNKLDVPVVSYNSDNSDANSKMALKSKIDHLEKLLCLEKDENLSLRNSLKQFSSHKCHVEDEHLLHVDKDSALIRLAEQNELLQKQIMSMQSSVIMKSSNELCSGNIISTDAKVSSIPTAEYVQLLLDVEKFKLMSGRQLNEIKYGLFSYFFNF